MLVCWDAKEKPTERRPALDIVAEKIARADGGELGKALEQPFRLRAFADSGRTDKNDAGGPSEAHITQSTYVRYERRRDPVKSTSVLTEKQGRRKKAARQGNETGDPRRSRGERRVGPD